MKSPDFDVAGHVAIVTGASRGIGHDLVLSLASAGAVVAATARSRHDLDALLDEVRGVGGRAFGVQMDVTDVASIRRAVHDVLAQEGHLVNNAGLGANHDAIDVTESDWDELMDVNLKGLFFMSQAAARPMIERGYGRIVNLSSQAGLVGIRRHAVYSASKGGVNLLTKVLAL